MHSLQLVHRDIKPENILWSDQLKRAVFSDFGISHFVKEKPGEKSHANFEGTRRYMSAELLALEKTGYGEVDLYRNDCYAFERSIFFDQVERFDFQHQQRLE